MVPSPGDTRGHLMSGQTQPGILGKEPWSKEMHLFHNKVDTPHLCRHICIIKHIPVEVDLPGELRRHSRLV